jgi:preprotein translocase subunit SecD
MALSRYTLCDNSIRKRSELKNPGLFYGAIAVAVVALLLCVYYGIPGVNHVLVSGNPTAAHFKHVALFGALTVLAVIGALVTRPKAVAK